jgi:hypothetical protein
MSQKTPANAEKRLSDLAIKTLRRLQKKDLSVISLDFCVLDGTDEYRVAVFRRRTDHYDVAVNKTSTSTVLVEL